MNNHYEDGTRVWVENICDHVVDDKEMTELLAESLNVLSNEEILIILSNLKSPQSIINFGKSSIRCNELSQKNSIWQELLKKHFLHLRTHVSIIRNEVAPRTATEK